MAGFPLAGTYRTPDGVTAGVMEALGAGLGGLGRARRQICRRRRERRRSRALHRLEPGHRQAIDVRVAHHFVVRGGLIVRFEQFVDTAEVRDAMRW